MQMMMSPLPMAAQMPSQLSGLASGVHSSSVTELPQQALQQITLLAGQVGLLSPDVSAEAFSAAGGDWVTATPAAGGVLARAWSVPVAASAVGVARRGGCGVPGSLRSPGSWSSTVNAAAPAASTEPAFDQRIAEARTGGTVASMGAPGR